MLKIEIKCRFRGTVIFAHDADDNTIAITLTAAVEDYTDPLIVIFDSHAGGGYPETPPDTTPFPHPDERPAFSLRAWLRSLWDRLTFRCPDDLVIRA